MIDGRHHWIRDWRAGVGTWYIRPGDGLFFNVVYKVEAGASVAVLVVQNCMF